jgi:23S rRNA maturation mini-RNase III
MSAQFEAVKKMINDLEDDFSKFYEKGNNAAGTRVRKGMQALKNKAQEIRLDIQARKNS